MNSSIQSIANLADDLAMGTVSSSDLVEKALDRIADPDGEGSRAFLSISAERARNEADLYDKLRAAGEAVCRFAGIPLAVKDLFDVVGETTAAGSVALADNEPASVDAVAVARLRNAGFVVMGRTNMTEFAFSGLGLNPHFEAPRSPWNRGVGGGRIPGGSSSGSAVAVADGMSAVGLGTDTGGSCRIPAAFCGLVGFKPTASRVPLAGTFPLSPSLDSIGPIARSVECCAIVDDVLAGGDGGSLLDSPPVAKVRLAALTDFVLDDLDSTVASAYGEALSVLAAAGAEIVEVEFAELLELPAINAAGGLAPYEAYRVHRDILAERADLYDPHVRARIEAGHRISDEQFAEVVEARRRLISVAAQRLDGFDAFVLPTVAITPPTFESFAGGDAEADVEYYRETNRLCLRNTSVGNFLDACSVSIPLAPIGEEPVGLMLMGRPMDDAQLLTVARTLEATVRAAW